MKNIIILISISLLCLELCSCDMDSFFDDPRPQEPQWVNTTTFEQGLSSAYYNLFYGCLNGRPMMFDFATSGIAHLLPGTSTSAPWNEMYNWMFNSNQIAFDDIWKAAYKTITTCNTAIGLDEAGNGNPFGLDMTQSDYKGNYTRQIGEYYFMRAYAYFTLVRIFAAPYVQNDTNTGRYIPFMIKTPQSENDIYSTPLGSNADIYAQIISDLKIAKSKLPGKYESSTMLPTYEVGRATRYTAAALLAKTLFLTGNYREVEPELTFVIDAAENENRFSLDEPIEAFNKAVRTSISKEAILEFDTGNTSLNTVSQYMYWGTIINLNFRDAKGGGRGAGMVKSDWCQFTFSYWAAQKMGWMTDPQNGDYSLTNEAKEDLRFQQLYYYLLAYVAGGDPLIYETTSSHTAVNQPQLYVDKYFRGGTVGTNETGRYTKFPLIRLADMYLIRAWVRWKDNNNDKAAEDMNKVWNRANPKHPDKYTSSNVNHDVIFVEYLKEMTGEGWTVDFMMATQMNIPVGDRQNLTSLAPPYSIWHWAIPVAEVGLNPNY